MRVAFSGCGSCYGASAVPRRSRLRTHVYGGFGFSAVPSGIQECIDAWNRDPTGASRICEERIRVACEAGTITDADLPSGSYSCKPPVSTHTGKQVILDDGSSATAQGVTPAPGGDIWAQLAQNYSRDTITKAIAWARISVPNPAQTAASMSWAATVYDAAAAGDLEARKRATRSMGYYWAEPGGPGSYPSGSPGTSLPGLNEALTECDRFLCPNMPSFAQKACQTAADKCREGINEAAEKGGAALNTALNNVLGGKLPDGSPPSSAKKEESIPAWAWLAGAGAAAMIVKVLLKKK